MSYIETYFSRVNHMGENVAEIAKNAGVRSFERWLKDSPNTVRQLSVERGLYFDGVILTNKDKEQSKIMLLNVAVDIPVEVGDIMNWDKEKWIIFSKEKKVRETHQTFSIIRCNYLMKWIDSEGHYNSLGAMLLVLWIVRLRKTSVLGTALLRLSPTNILKHSFRAET